MTSTVSFFFGIFMGVAVFIFSIASENTKIITNSYKCSKTSIVGKSPNREEICVEYTFKKTTK